MSADAAGAAPTPLDVARGQRRTDGSWLGENLERLRSFATAAAHFGPAVADVVVSAAHEGEQPAEAVDCAASDESLPVPGRSSVREWIARGEQAMDDADDAHQAGQKGHAWHHRGEAALAGLFGLARGMGQLASAAHRTASALERIATTAETDQRQRGAR